MKNVWRALGAVLSAALVACSGTDSAAAPDASSRPVDGGANRWPRADGGFVVPPRDGGRMPDGGTDPWAFVVLPDTQYYRGEDAELFVSQTRWIAEERERESIWFVLHVGDITDNDTPDEWAVAQSALRDLDGVPFAVVPGNHDYVDNARTRSSRLDDFLPVSIWRDQGTLGGSYEFASSANTVQFFDTPEGPWLALALEFGPRRPVVEWAAEVLREHRGLRALMFTHAYLYSDGTRYDVTTRSDQQWNPYGYGVANEPGGVTDGQELFDALVEPFSDVELVLSGHVHNNGGAARLTDERTDGTLVHQLLSNYQAGPRGGSGFLRIVRVFEDRFVVETYSPFLNEYKRDPQNEFTLMRYRATTSNE